MAFPLSLSPGQLAEPTCPSQLPAHTAAVPSKSKTTTRDIRGIARFAEASCMFRPASARLKRTTLFIRATFQMILTAHQPFRLQPKSRWYPAPHVLRTFWRAAARAFTVERRSLPELRYQLLALPYLAKERFVSKFRKRWDTTLRNRPRSARFRFCSRAARV